MEDDRFSANHSQFAAHCRRRPNFMTRAAKGSKYDNTGGPESWLEDKKWWHLSGDYVTMQLDLHSLCWQRHIAHVLLALAASTFTFNIQSQITELKQNISNYFAVTVIVVVALKCLLLASITIRLNCMFFYCHEHQHHIYFQSNPSTFAHFYENCI